MKSFSTQVDGLEVQIIKFNPMKGGTVLGTAMKMFAPSIKELVQAAGTGLSEEKQVDILVQAVQELFTNQSPKEVMDFLAEVVAGSYVIVNDKKITHLDDFESLVGEDGDALYVIMMIAAESIKYNFAGFLGKLMPSQASSKVKAKA